MYKLLLKGLLLYAAFLICVPLNAQYYLLPPVQNGKNPGNLNRDNENPQGSGLTAGWQTILQGPQASGNWTATFQLPFKFYFYGNLVRSFKASTSGVVTFNSRTSLRVDSNNVALPSSRIPDSSICIWGLRAASGDFIVAKTFGTAPHRQYWISYNSFSEQNLQSGGHVYVSIVLEETTNKIYLVDQRVVCLQNGVECTGKTNLTLGIQLDSLTAMMVPGSPDYPCSNNNLSTTEDNLYHTFIPGQRPALDAEGQSLNLNAFYLTREFPQTIVGQFKNIGTETINKVSFEYQIDNGPIQSSVISGLNVPALSEFQVTHPVPWNLSDPKFNTHNVRAWIGLLNDAVPAQPADDTIATSLLTSDTVYTRILLHENFSSSTSANGKIANDTLHKILNDFPGLYTEVYYPLGSPQGGDPYTTIESIARARLYAIGNFNIPRLLMDGAGAINAASYSRNAFRALQEIPSFYQVVPSGTVKGQDVEINIEIRNVAPIPSNTRLHVVVAERETIKNVKTNGETVFYHVVKKMLPDTLGMMLDSLPSDSSLSVKLLWSVPGNYRLPADGRTTSIINLNTEHSIEDFSKLEVVAWLQEKDNTVLQSGRADLQYVVNSQDEAVASVVKIFPNPANQYFFLDLSTLALSNPTNVKILDLNGSVIFNSKAVQSSQFINTTDWPTGTYWIQVEANKQRYVTSLQIQR